MKNFLKKTVVLIGFLLCSFGFSYGTFEHRYQDFINDKTVKNFNNLKTVWEFAVKVIADKGFGSITDEEYLMALVVEDLVRTQGGKFGMGIGEYKGSRSILDENLRKTKTDEYNQAIAKQLQEIAQLKDLKEKDNKVMELYEKYKEAGAVLRYNNYTLAVQLLQIFLFDLIDKYLDQKNTKRAEELYNIAQEYYTYMTAKHYISLRNVDMMLGERKRKIDSTKGVASAPTPALTLTPAPAPAPTFTPTITTAATPAATSNLPVLLQKLTMSLGALKTALGA